MFSLRQRGIAALAEPKAETWLSELSEAQIEQCMVRVATHSDVYSDTNDLLDALADQIS